MPYKVVTGAGCPESRPFAVVKETDGQRMGCHPTKDRAERQLRALYAAEVEPDPEIARLIEYVAEAALAERGYVRDARGRFAAHGSTVAPADAVSMLASGGRPDIAPRDVGDVMDRLAGRDDHPDLTRLHIEGTPKFGLDGLGHGRTEMPVLGTKHLPGYLADLQSRGVRVTDGRIGPQSLRPMQAEISGPATARIYQKIRNDSALLNKPVVASRDNVVIDGHHRWGGAVALSFERPGITLAVTRIDMDAETLRLDALAWNAANGISSKAIGEALLAEFNSRQPRDRRGRWARAGGGGIPGGVDTATAWRGIGGAYAPERAALHREVIEGKLAGLPTSDRPTLYMTGGGPASGKTDGLLKNPDSGIPGTDKAAHIDPDAMKAALPEYREAVKERDPWAAARVHEESSYMAKVGVSTGLSRGHDVVYDSVGDSGIASLTKKVNTFRSHNPGTVVRAEYATCSVETALARANKRAKKGRVVPEEVLRSAHADVSRTFVSAVNGDLFDSARLWDTEGASPRLVFSYDRTTGPVVHNESLWRAFLAKGEG
jgi:hypothetical protein